MAAKLTDAERQTIADLVQTGISYGAIAKQVGRSTGTVARVARSIGWTPEQSNRDRTREANRTRKAYSAERRAHLAARFTEECELLLDQLHREHLAFNFGGKDNDYNERTLDEPPVDAKRALIQAAREAMRTVIDIDRHDNKADDGLAAVDQWLRGLVGEETAA